MDTEDKLMLLNPLRYGAAVLIALGGSMHLVGMIRSVIDKQSFPWWFWAIFLIAIPGYFISAVLILKNRLPGYIFAVMGPIVGGTLIFLGFVFPESKLLILIPGTYTNEIMAIGFLTLISEPIATSFSAFLIYHKFYN